jgi:hypothetical protein
MASTSFVVWIRKKNNKENPKHQKRAAPVGTALGHEPRKAPRPPSTPFGSKRKGQKIFGGWSAWRRGEKEMSILTLVLAVTFLGRGRRDFLSFCRLSRFHRWMRKYMATMWDGAILGPVFDMTGNDNK